MNLKKKNKQTRSNLSRVSKTLLSTSKYLGQIGIHGSCLGVTAAQKKERVYIALHALSLFSIFSPEDFISKPKENIKEYSDNE